MANKKRFYSWLEYQLGTNHKFVLLTHSEERKPYLRATQGEKTDQKKKKAEHPEKCQQSAFLGKLREWPGYFWGQSLCSWGQVMVRSRMFLYCWWWFSHWVKSHSCGPMDCILPGSSGHGILQARILEWVAISFFRGPSKPKNQT